MQNKCTRVKCPACNTEFDFTPTKAADLYDRLSRNILQTDSCWEWTGFLDKRGYGRFSVKLKTFTAHRFVFSLLVGPIPDGLFVCHHCDNPACVNPEHLFVGTHTDNMRDRARKGRNPSQTHPERLPRGEQCSWARLTEADVLRIREMHRNGLHWASIADQFETSHQNVYAIITRKSWKHI